MVFFPSFSSREKLFDRKCIIWMSKIAFPNQNLRLLLCKWRWFLCLCLAIWLKLTVWRVDHWLGQLKQRCVCMCISWYQCHLTANETRIRVQSRLRGHCPQMNVWRKTKQQHHKMIRIKWNEILNGLESAQQTEKTIAEFNARSAEI